MSAPLLRVAGLSKRFGGLVAPLWRRLRLRLAPMRIRAAVGAKEAA
jgi:ABC-type branched-subunit amino acid transport system ATPase component